MKKSYIKPAMSVYLLSTKQILLTSGPGASDQTNPGMGAPLFDDDFDSAPGL